MADEIRSETHEPPELTHTVSSDPKLCSNPPLSAFRSPLYDLYLEQQRRLACPGCGEEAFLG